MLMRKRLAWLILLAFAAASVSLIIATRHSSGAASMEPQRTKVKVLRRKDRLHLKPTAQEIQDNQPPPEERSLEDQIPKNVPIKIKIRKEKEKAFKDLKNDKWARDFELEVTNTGEKPIYYLYLLMVTEVKAAGGSRIAFPLTFGRTELGSLRERAQAEDIKIAPGETIVLKIHPGQLGGYTIRQREENRPHPKKMKVKLEILSFGDGTGYAGEDGTLLPHERTGPLGLGGCTEPPNRGSTLELLASAVDVQRSAKSFGNRPASFLPVYFFSSNPLKTRSRESAPQPEGCCSGDGCTSLTTFAAHVLPALSRSKPTRNN